MALKKQRVDKKNAEVIKRGDYTRALDSIIAGGFCPFCEEHLFKHHRHPLIYKSRHWLVTKNAWPYKGSRFHFLFITRTHVETTEDISPMAWADLRKLYRKLVKENSIQGATLLVRSADTKFTGASINHLHAHLIVGGPRTRNAKPITALVGFEK